ncbi:carbohydrate ABC transporter permease [Cohnella sp. GCM10012308]|uniref:carbohydrate ABC transporter permease n=1 Tax=Cohnella sp. GCM10012308 TaxID=3317329 RepID=UPI00360C2CE2
MNTVAIEQARTVVPVRRERRSAIFVNVFFILLSTAMIVPLLLVVSVSLTSEASLTAQGYHLIPQAVSLEAYRVILQHPGQIARAYGVTICVTVLGTLLALAITTALAYAIARRDYRYRRITTLYVFFTMLFNGGLVPFYILVTQYLHLKDTIWALIVPAMLTPFNVLVMKGFLDKLPPEIYDSAHIDGAGEWRIYTRIVLPLATPALATLSLFIAFAYWNDWWLGLLFIDNPKLVPLQLLLYRIMSSIDFMLNNIGKVNVAIDISRFPDLSARMAMAVLAAGPMMFIFPLFQRYFVAGLTVGSVKS